MGLTSCRWITIAGKLARRRRGAQPAWHHAGCRVAVERAADSYTLICDEPSMGGVRDGGWLRSAGLVVGFREARRGPGEAEFSHYVQLRDQCVSIPCIAPEVPLGAAHVELGGPSVCIEDMRNHVEIRDLLAFGYTVHPVPDLQIDWSSVGLIVVVARYRDARIERVTSRRGPFEGQSSVSG